MHDTSVDRDDASVGRGIDLGLPFEGASGAKLAVVVEVGKHRGESHVEHPPADPIEHPRDDEAADAGEAGVVPREACTAPVRLQQVGDRRQVVLLAAEPRVPEEGWPPRVPPAPRIPRSRSSQASGFATYLNRVPTTGEKPTGRPPLTRRGPAAAG